MFDGSFEIWIKQLALTNKFKNYYLIISVITKFLSLSILYKW